MKIAFDIDDTLWKVRREKPFGQYPDHDLIQVLRWFAQNGDEVFVWSAGGLDYARQIVEKLGLEKLVTVIQKGNDTANELEIDLSFDDEQVFLGKANVRVKRDLSLLDEIHSESEGESIDPEGNDGSGGVHIPSRE